MSAPHRVRYTWEHPDGPMRMKRGGFWGHHIDYAPGETGALTATDQVIRLYGHMDCTPQVGDLVDEEGSTARWTLRIVWVERCRDPRDMFFADAVLVKQWNKATGEVVYQSEEADVVQVTRAPAGWRPHVGLWDTIRQMFGAAS